ncbi:SDR family NAD(P)-dependent oxidoreductase [Pseudomonas izuensis]|uniref:SDR family NAD(P)-dependent oxidoreductase n=2 Tax=Pseudomonas izuensis TaxID=2684212 RepID=A0ABM7RX03_9PSED|nr:SDR family NAD(P)-dependent oxidoreductase [Pseudomonas izuensis]
MTGNTIFITGGGSGIGRGLAEAFHKLGNQVIISGRRKERLQQTLDANPGMAAIELDITDPDSIQAAAQTLLSRYPDLNVLINNAGVMMLDNAGGAVDDALAQLTVTTNLLGPIRMTSALVEHLKAKPDAVIANVSSVLGFVPMAVAAVYSATKAALHSYTLSQRYLLREQGIQLVEVAPPWVRTELLNSSEEERAIPLDQFITQAMEQFESGVDEVLVSPAEAMRANPGPNEHAWVDQFNDMLASGPALG